MWVTRCPGDKFFSESLFLISYIFIDTLSDTLLYTLPVLSVNLPLLVVTYYCYITTTYITLSMIITLVIYYRMQGYSPRILAVVCETGT